MVDLPPQDTTLARIWAHHEKKNDEPPRPHLGASQVGAGCERAIWYGFRWAKKPIFDGRILRLFETGHLQEERVKAELRAIGVTVYDENPETALQFGFEDGHLKGSVDGVLLGLPESPKTPHLFECKTANDRSFKQIAKAGVKEAKPQHYAQMMVYCHYMKLKRALYVVVNKNTDDLHIERIEYSATDAKRYIERAKRIIASEEPPARIAESSKAFACKFCDYKDLCFEGAIPEANCRTCASSTAEPDGGWTCNKGRDMSASECGGHLFHPSLMPATAEKGSDGWVAYRTDSGKRFLNVADTGFPASELGDEDTALLSSQELQHLDAKKLEHASEIGTAKRVLEATVVG